METEPAAGPAIPSPHPWLRSSSTGYSRETEVFLTPWASVHRKDLVSQFQGKKLQLLQLAGSANQAIPEVLLTPGSRTGC